VVDLEPAEELENLCLLGYNLLSHLFSSSLLVLEVFLQLSCHIKVLALISRTLIQMIEDIYRQ
jgi:hypothetical protein